MAFSLRTIKRFLFGILSRTGLAVYSRLPIFGALPAAVCIIRDGDLVLVIDRSDGRGLSLPGGFSAPREKPEETVEREVHEETGLQVEKSTLLFTYRTSVDIPCIISVFEAKPTGKLRESWEGVPRWLPLGDVRPFLLPNQKEIVDRLLNAVAL